jgi:hypothetical protein
MLTGVTDQSDNTALLTAVQGVLSSALGTTSSTTKQTTTKGPEAGPPGGAKTTSETNIRQDFSIYKLLFDQNGNFYGLAYVPKDAQLLKQIREAEGRHGTLAPIRAPTFDGRELETSATRTVDSKRAVSR